MRCPDGLTLLLGGARSGKSDLAQRLAEASALPVVFVATAEARDDDMAARIERHRADRPVEWTTVEEPVDLTAAIAGAPDDATLVVDCLTLWTANLFFAEVTAGQVLERSSEAAALCSRRPGATIVVTNEVGAGLHPPSEIERSYGDLLGRVNAAWASHATRSWLVAAGRVAVLQDPEELA